MFGYLLYRITFLLSNLPKWFLGLLVVLLVASPFLGIAITIVVEDWDKAPDRGAIAMESPTLGESFSTPQYLNQGWEDHDSLWFYNATQGSALLPYDFMLALTRKDDARGTCSPKNDQIKGDAPFFLCDQNVDYYRYLPQRATFSNPDALPVGFTKTTYKKKDYIGLTCAACHTGQINFKGEALRIDGGPAMSDMVGFLEDLTRSLQQAMPDAENSDFDAFAKRVLALGNDYTSRESIVADLREWLDKRQRYNSDNRPFYVMHDGEAKNPTILRNVYSSSHICGKDSAPKTARVDYGYARLDAFGRIYNRVLQHTINQSQLAATLGNIRTCKGQKGKPPKPLLTEAEINLVMSDFRKSGDVVLKDKHFIKILKNLRSDDPGYPNLSNSDMIRVRNELFNSPNAPVSYPFLWDITHADYVQWNGIGNNATLGPLGRNVGEVLGVFAILDWHEDKGFIKKYFPNVDLPGILSGQSSKQKAIRFQSSVDIFNLGRLERKLQSLTSPAWPFCREEQEAAYYLPGSDQGGYVDERHCKNGDHKLDKDRVRRGDILFKNKCIACHTVIEPRDPKRIMTSFMVGIDSKNKQEVTDEAMARNSVMYSGKSGNLKDTYQSVEVGTVIMREDAPAAQILTAVTRGTLGTTDYSISGISKWVYSVVMSLRDNQVKQSVKAGDYTTDTTASPYASLQSYRARSLNGIWATAPYLHNGSVPTLYDLLLPVDPGKECKEKQARPKTFKVGMREFDPVKVGYISDSDDSDTFIFDVMRDDGIAIPGNNNKGHEYGACDFTHEDRLDLIEYMKSL